MRICVLGAGIAGLASAYYLARDGHEVTVVDRREAVAAETSFANAGLLVPSQALPWNEPGIVRHALKWLFEQDGALVIRPRPDPAMLAWLARFIGYSRPESFRRSTLASLALARLSVAETDAVADRHGMVFDRTARGILTLIRDRADKIPAERAAATFATFGIDCRMLEPAEVVAMEPALAPIAAGIAGALLTPEDGSGDLHTFCVALAGVLRGLGTRFEMGRTVRGFDIRAGRVAAVRLEGGEIAADAFVLALGSGSRALARAAGFSLPIYPVQGCSITFDTSGWNGAPAVPVRDRRRRIAMTPFGGRLRVAGMAILAGGTLEVDDRHYQSMRRAIREVFPGLPADADETRWSGLRPMTPDGPPIVGPSPVSNLWINTGQGPLGWTLGCGSARLLAALVKGEPPPVAAEPYRFDRYRL